MLDKGEVFRELLKAEFSDYAQVRYDILKLIEKGELPIILRRYFEDGDTTGRVIFEVYQNPNFTYFKGLKPQIYSIDGGIIELKPRERYELPRIQAEILEKNGVGRIKN